jgi:hypothetical protein
MPAIPPDAQKDDRDLEVLSLEQGPVPPSLQVADGSSKVISGQMKNTLTGITTKYIIPLFFTQRPQKHAL